MRKRSYYILMLIVASIWFVSCDIYRESQADKMNDRTELESVVHIDNSIYKELTAEYSIEELKSFFNDHSINEDFEDNKQLLLFSEVDRKYPVEILRDKKYTVYKVEQGGFFYVFWIDSFSDKVDGSESELCVYFTAYFTSDRTMDLFAAISPGLSTAEDVKEIDASLELSFLRSSGIYSYSFLDDNTILQIEYDAGEEIKGDEDLIVKDISTIPRKTAPSVIGTILSEDLP